MKDIHDPMPVILTGKDKYKPWLEESQHAVLKEFLWPFQDDIRAYPVYHK